MNQNNYIKGIVLSCSPDGITDRIWHDDIGITQLNPVNKPFIHLLDKGSRQKGLSFLYDSQSQKSNIGVQMDVMMGEKIITMTFAGLLLKDQILVVAAEDSQETSDFLNQLQQINNEHINTIRMMVKANMKDTRQTIPSSEDNQLYDEITRLNNEMANFQRQLTKKNIELDRVNQLKNKFIGVAAHDLRNPLNIIQSYADFLAEEAEGVLEAEHLEFLNRIIESSNYMLKLIENLLDYSKIETGEMHLQKESLELVSFLKRIVDMNNMLAQRKNIKIDFHTDADAIQLLVDPEKMEQVFNNLLSNAVKFSHPDSHVEVNLLQQDKKVQVRIADRGTGMKTDDIKQVFLPFTKISKKGTSGEKGTGLGLSIVKRIIEEHDGSVEVDSEQGKGTAFTIMLPLSSENHNAE
ncbi:MAG: sensor histidine kinase [Bacteroidota bacterium]